MAVVRRFWLRDTLTVDMDLVRLDLRAPLVDAACATICSVWCEAADLWLEVCHEPAYRDLGVQCGAQASLNAGLLDLAEYFLIGLNELPEIPEFLAPLWAKNVAVREARVKYYSRIIDVAPRKLEGINGRELMRLHLYREAIHQFLAGGEFGRDPKETIPQLARAYSMLGAHASLVGLYESQRIHMEASDQVTMVDRAKRLLKRQAEPPERNLIRFQEQHPAGAELKGIIDRLGPRVDGEGSHDL